MGGIGGHLTGADTVIFYDSDWNPTINARVEESCHRIGQTKDVQIYRLIHKNTVEESVFNKANPKRLLSDYFNKNQIRELFNSPSSIEDLDDQRMDSGSLITTRDHQPVDTQFEEALALVEDERDRQAADELNREMNAEFDEDEIDNLHGNEEEQLEIFDQQVWIVVRFYSDKPFFVLLVATN